MTDSPEFNASLREVFSSGQATPSFHERVLDRLRDGVYFVDRERRILYWNKGAELLTGYSSGEVVGKYCFDNILAHVNGAGCDICLSGCPLAITIHDGECREVEVYLRHKLGHRIPVSIRSAPLMDDGGRIIGAVEVFSDATTKRNIERRVGQLESVAFLDPLTGVPNRRYIELKITQAIQDVQQFGRRAGLMMIDVDHFKHVNDKYGHPIGDAVLCALCNTIMPNLRLGDVLGRWGGEEFLLIVRDVTPKSLTIIAEKLRALIAQTAVPVGAEHLRITVSIGATLMADGDSDQTAIKRADELMYRSKTAGRNRVNIG